MKKLSILASAAACAAVVMIGSTQVATAQGGGWRCSAPGIMDYSYDGGSVATIHLRGYSYGDSYSVTKAGGNAVRGVTGNGTPFTCRKA